MTGTTLLIGGSGRTPSRIATRLQARGIPVLLTSRKGQAGVPEGFKGVTFDWYEEATYDKPFEAEKTIDTIYLVLPVPKPDTDRIAVSKKFIDFARTKGVNRFLLMSATPIEKGGPANGQIHAYLEEIGSDYAVLRPSWFYGNLLRYQLIKENSEIVTSADAGKVGFIDEDDIADVAVDLLSSPKLGGSEKIIVGPELLSYDEVAETLTQVLCRKIVHRKVTPDERKVFYHTNFDVPEEIGAMLGFLEANVIATGGEEKTYQRKDKVVGKTKYRDFIEANKTAWQ